MISKEMDTVEKLRLVGKRMACAALTVCLVTGMTPPASWASESGGVGGDALAQEELREPVDSQTSGPNADPDAHSDAVGSPEEPKPGANPQTDPADQKSDPAGPQAPAEPAAQQADPADPESVPGKDDPTPTDLSAQSVDEPTTPDEPSLPGPLVNENAPLEPQSIYNKDNKGHEGWTAAGLFRHIMNHTRQGSAAYNDAATALNILYGKDGMHTRDVASTIDFESAGDAVSLEAMDIALDYVDIYNYYRARENSEEGTNLSTNVGVNCRMLAISIVQCDWSRARFEHSQAFSVGENLAWGYDNPFDGWYDKEKENYKQNPVWSGDTGHYLNIVDNHYQSGYTQTAVTGFAICLDSATYGICHEQSFDKWYYTDVVYSVNQFRSLWFDDYFKAMQREGMSVRFPDVTSDDWFFDVARRAAGTGLIAGYADGRFGPKDVITRGQLATILWRMANNPSAGHGGREFPDVTDPNAYYYDAVMWAGSVGVVSGYTSGYFGPNDPVTREQLAAMLANYASRVAGVSVDGSRADYGAMSDASNVSPWAARSLGWCFRNRIMSGTSDGRINPKSSASRAEAAKMILGLYDLVS